MNCFSPTLILCDGARSLHPDFRKNSPIITRDTNHAMSSTYRVEVPT